MAEGRLRRVRVWGVLSLSVGFFYGSVQQSVHGLFDRDRWNWGEMAVVSAVWAALWLPATLFGQWVGRRGVERGWVPTSPARRRQDGYEQLVEPALAAGALPADADPDTWRPALEAQVRDAKVMRWCVLVPLAGCSALVAAAAIAANDNAWGVWTVAVVLLAEGVVGFALLGRPVGRIDRLLAQLS